MKIKAVFFDAGGTLFRPHPSVGELYAAVARKYGMEMDAAEIEPVFKAEFTRRDKIASAGAHASEKDEKQWWSLLVRSVLARITEIKNFEAYFEELYDLFARAEAWKLYPEVPEVLEKLKAKKMILGIVSNWDHRLYSICDEMKLTFYFDFILASAVVGSAKPDAEIFKEALKRAGIGADEAIHVGDSVDNDYRGAREAGIRPLLVDRNGQTHEGVEAVSSLAGVFSLLD